MSLTPFASTAILERFRRGNPGKGPGDIAGIDLTLRPAYRELLTRLGEPQNHLPPAFHVAGTNGKGSTCAFLRAILEAAGYRAHVYTSPHLVSLHERFRIAGKLIGEDELAALLLECEELAQDFAPSDGITMFEAMTAVAFAAFARHPADFTILETGLGGRLDATNVVESPRATIITRLSYDHREFLGSTLAEIAREKAGIMKKDVPCFAAAQPDAESMATLRACAEAIGASFREGGKDWRIETTENGSRFIDKNSGVDLPPPALAGAHQMENAGLAIAALRGTGFTNDAAITKGLKTVEWPARLQRLDHGVLPETLGPQWELWLDGGHNDSAGEVLAAEAALWKAKDGRPLHLLFGMLKTKTPGEFLAPLAPHIASLHAVAVPDEPQSFPADELAAQCRAAGIENAAASPDVPHALREIRSSVKPGRVLICGSLYLAGDVLRQNAG